MFVDVQSPGGTKYMTIVRDDYLMSTNKVYFLSNKEKNHRVFHGVRDRHRASRIGDGEER